MAEQIGLVGIFDASQFTKGMSGYSKQLDSAISQTNKASGSFAKSWGDMGKTVAGVTKTMGVAIVAAGAAATAAITGFAVSGINKAKDLEAQMSNIAAVFNTTAEGVAPLQELILELGVDPNLKVSTMEAADAIEMLGKNGLTMTQIMDGAARSTVLLANATGADFGVAADIATDAMAIFGIEAANMDAAVNGITAVTVASKFSIDDYRLAMAQAGGVAGAVGVEFDDFNTTIAAISPAFASGSDAGTSYKTMLQRLLPQSKEAEEMMRDLGIITADGANQFFTASGEMKSMNDIAVILNGALAGLTEEQKLNAVTVLAGADASRAMLGLMDAGAVVYTDAAEAARALGVSQEEVNKVIEGGVTQFEALQLTMGQTDAVQQAQTRMDNFAGAMEILQGVIETIQIRIGQAFLPMLTELAKAFTALVENNSDKIVGFFTTLSDVITGVVKVFSSFITTGEGLSATEVGLTGTTAELADKIINLGFAIYDGLAFALQFIQQHMELFKGALIGIAAVMAAATITAGITAMAGAIASLFNPITLIILAAAGLGIAWNTNWLGIRDTTANVVSAVQTHLGPLLETLQTLGGGILTTIRDHWQEIAAGVTGFAAVLAIANIPAAFAAISAAVTGAGAVIGGVLAAINLPLLAVAAAVALLAAAWTGNWFGMRDAVVSAWESIKATFEPMTTAIQEFGAGALTEIQNFVTGNETEFTNLKAIWTGVQESFGAAFGGIRAWVIANLPGFQTTLTEWGTAASQWITDAIPIIDAKLAEWWLAIDTFIATNLPTWQANLKLWGDAAWQWLQDAAGQLLITLGGWWLTISTYVTSQLPTWQATLLSWADAAWQWIQDAIPVVQTKLGEWWTALSTYITNNLPTWTATLKGWGDAAWQWIVDAVPLVTTQIGQWGQAIFNYVLNNLPTWQANLLSWGEAAWQWIVDAAGVVATRLGEWWAALTNYVTGQLPTWQTQFTEWTTELWQWIVDAVPLVATKLGEWWTAISDYLTNTALPAFTTKMLEWATALVEWIGSSAADALPKLGEWLGKITAWVVLGAALLVIEMAKFAAAIISWIPGAIAQLPAKLVELKDALIGWIAGTGGEGGGAGSLVGEAPTAMEKFKTALINALDGIKEGFLAAVQGFVRSFSDTLSEYIDWEFVGRNIMTFVRNGISLMKKTILDKVNEIVTALGDAWKTVVNWIQTGKDVIQGVIDGLQEMLNLGSLATKAGELVTSAANAFLNYDWLSVGKSIIDGIKKGLEEKGGEIVSFLTGLGSQALDAIKGLFGIESPSKVMAEIGRDIIDGWVLGMVRNEHRILNAMQSISLGVSRIAHRAGQDAIDAYTGALGSFGGVGGNLIDRIAGTQAGDNIAKLITGEQGTLEFLQQQADIIQAVKDAGLDPSDVLAGLTLGRNADPLKLAGVVGRTMQELNRGLEQSIKNAASGLTRTIDEMRAGRKSITDIEQQFTQEHISVLGNYANRLQQVDDQIAQAEEQTLRTGGGGMQWLKDLERQRNRLLAEVKEFHQQRVRLERLLTTTPDSDNQRAQEAMDRWRAQWLDPLVKLFEAGDIFTRRSMWPQIQRRMKELQQFANQLPRIADVELKAMQALEGFGQGARGRVENLLTALYDPNQARHLDANIIALREFANELHQIKAELSSMARARPSTETITERVMGSFDQLQAYQNAIASIDAQIERVQEGIMASGQHINLQTIRNLDVTRERSAQELETFLRQTQRLSDIMAQVKNLSGPGQASAERFLQEMIQPIADAFSGPMRAIDRDAWLRTAQERVATLNRFVDQMRQVERLQARVAGNQAFTHLADDFALLQDMLMPEATRAGLISKLDDYITQMMRLHDIQQDISQGRGINPLVERFASERLDGIARQLEDINLSEAERNRLIQQYRVEQEKVLALQEKQQRLDFLNQQLALIEQLRSLDDEEGWSVDVENILSGIRFGVNASIDDLMALTGRVLDELVKFANHELGIASPSRVFARVGENIMAGLAMGVENGLRLPMNALQRAAGSLVPYNLQQRALTINMGGVTINDRVDAALFENRIRQIVRNEFAS